jgi:O-antigen/teichoic acid export membrane protein
LKFFLNKIYSTEKNVFIFTILDLFVLGFNSIIIVPVLVKILPKDVLANYTLYLVYNTIFIVIFQFGLISSFSRYYFLENEKKISKRLIYTIHTLVSFICLLILILYYYLNPSIEAIIYFGSAIVSYLSFYISLEIVYQRLENNLKNHYFLQFFNTLSYVVILYLASFFVRISLPTIIIINITIGALFTLILITKRKPTEINNSFKHLNKDFISETFSYYILNIIFVLITRSLPVFLESKISNKILLTELNISLIYSSLSFVLVASFNKFSLNKFFKEKVSDESLKIYYLLYHLSTTLFFIVLFKFFFTLSFSNNFKNLWHYFSIFIICNYIWNISLIENMTLQKKYKVKIIRNIYFIIFFLFLITLFYFNKYTFNFKYIFYIQFIISILFFYLNYYFGGGKKETVRMKLFTAFSLVVGIVIYATFIQFI